MADTKKYDIGALFSGKRSGSTVVSFKDPSPYVPLVDPDYLWPEWTRDVLVWLLMDRFQPLYVFGPSGAGKSSCLRQVCARINMPVYCAVGSERLEVSDLIGHYVLKDQETVWVDGPLTQAVRNGGLFIQDEADCCPASVLTALHGVLDGTGLVIAEHNEVVMPHPLFRIAVTGNSRGQGDETGFYTGVAMQSTAYLDRFLFIEAAYPDPKAEASLLQRKFPKLPGEVVNGMVRVANMIRKLFQNDEPGQQPCEITVTTRSLLRWADLSLRYSALANVGISPVEYAAALAFGNRASRPTRTMITELTQRVFAETIKEEKS